MSVGTELFVFQGKTVSLEKINDWDHINFIGMATVSILCVYN